MNEELERIIRNERGYASYFHFGKDRKGTETSVVFDWLRARYGDDDKKFVKIEWRENPNDPPDVVLTDNGGMRYGIEVTEFVDEETIKAHRRGETRDPKEYSVAEFRLLLTTLIKKKANAAFKGEGCDRKILVIYCDEPDLRSLDEERHLSGLRGRSHQAIDEIWFMTPPPVHTSGGPPPFPNCRICEIR